MKMNRVVITGGAGFIGSHLSEALVDRGVEVIVYDNLSTGKRENIPALAKFIEGDIRDNEKLLSAMTGADGVVHLAARVSVRSSCQNFVEDAEINLLGTLKVLEICAQTKPKKFVLASSMAVYADSPNPVPVSESYSTAPVSPYGISKLAAEQCCLILSPNMNLSTIALRFFNTYGTRQTVTPYVGVITIFINRLLKGQPPIIFGDGKQCRDFVHVSDIAAGCIIALESDAQNCVCNIGTGKATNVNDIANLLCSRIAPEIKPQWSPAHPGELQNCIADITQAKKLLGYEPKMILEDKIDEVIAYIRDQTK